MAFNTKLKLVNAKFEQVSGSTLTLSGNTLIADDGTFKYSTPERAFTEDGELVDKYYVDQQVSGATSGQTTYDTVWMADEQFSGGTLQTWYDFTQSAGRYSGGTLTSGGGTTVNVAAGAGLKKLTDDRIGENEYVTWEATAVTVTTGYNYIYYDANLDAIQVTQAEAEIEANDNFNLGRVYYDSTLGLIIRLCGQNLWNLNRRLHLYGDQVYGVQRASGMIISNPTGLQIAVTGGVLWAELLNRFTTSGFTSASDNFYEWTYASSAWSPNEITAPGSVNNDSWNDRSGAGAISALTGSYYTLRWVYVLHDSSVHVVWGDAEYSGLTEALLETAPADVPDVVGGYGTLVGRVVVQEGNSNAVETDSAFDQVFATSTVQAHNDLSGIQGGAPGEYYHLSNADILAVNAALTGATNGLTEIAGRQVKLGGTALCETTTIDPDGNVFEISNGSAFKLCLDEASDAISLTTQAGSSITIDAVGEVALSDSVGSAGVETKSGVLCLDGTIWATDTPSAGALTDTVLVRNSTNGAVRTLTVSQIIGTVGAANGVCKDGDNFVLGGTLTGNTTIAGGTNDLTFNGLTNFNVTATNIGLTGILTNTGNIIGTQNLNISGATWLESTLRVDGTVTLNSVGAGDSSDAILVLDSTGAVQCITQSSLDVSANNGLSAANNNVTLGGALTGDTCIYGSHVLDFNVNEICITGATAGVKIGGNSVYLCNLTGGNDLVCINETTGLLGTTSLSSFGGITGGTNGICDTGSQTLALGGSLTEATTILGTGNTFSLGTAVSQLDTFSLFASSTICLDSDENININVSGGTITTTDNKGLRYTGAYESSFVDASLVSKCYVDTVATGLQPHDTVLVATTANITLSGAQTIDGVSVDEGDRVLVKDQTSGATNGIYVVASGGSWTRATDFDGTPVGEVVNGDLVPVESGSTQANTIWVLTTPDPIDVGTTDLEFTLFSRLLGISAGDGIDVTPVGSTQQISVDLAANGGLCINATELQVNDAIAGTALAWSSGVLNVCAASGGTAGISVKYDGSENLVVNASDIDTALGGVLSGSSNGLTDAAGVVCLGGALTTATTICGSVADSCGLTYQDLAVTNHRGIVYAADYSDSFIDNSLVSKKYVDDCMTASAITFTNGLTEISNSVCLGGTLTEATTTIDTDGNVISIANAGANGICITSTDTTLGDVGLTDAHIAVGSSLFICGQVADICGTSDSNICFTAGNGANMVIDSINGGTLSMGNTGGNIFTDNTGNGYGIQYDTTYESTFQPLSLVTKCYVDTCVTGGSIQTVSNGLTADGTNVRLGGTLTGNTSILGDGSHGITFGDFNDRTDFDNFSVYGYTVNLYGRNAVFVEGGALGVGIKSDSGLTQTLNLCAGDICVTGLATYAANYSGSYTARSIPDVAFVTGNTSGITGAFTTANNGLCSGSANVVSLGGTLTGNTTIGGASTHSLTLNALTAFNATASSIGLTGPTQITGTATITSTLTLNSVGSGSVATDSIVVRDSGGIIKQINVSDLDVTADNGLTANGNEVVLGGDLTGATTIGGASTLTIGNNTTITGTTTLTSVASGSTTDDVLTITSGGEIQKISADSLGEDNNVYAIRRVTGNTTATDTDYTLLVESAEGAITVTLPTGATHGQAYKIKDVDGDALSSNITISGNGNNIDGSATATINTDYGALELVYDDTVEEWFALSFVN